VEKLAEMSWLQAVLLLVIAGTILFVSEPGPLRIALGFVLVAFVGVAEFAKFHVRGRTAFRNRGNGADNTY
jgi:multisubunit Na+/H+ antiporter MnhF subunit